MDIQFICICAARIAAVSHQYTAQILRHTANLQIPQYLAIKSSAITAIQQQISKLQLGYSYGRIDSTDTLYTVYALRYGWTVRSDIADDSRYDIAVTPCMHGYDTPVMVCMLRGCMPRFRRAHAVRRVCSLRRLQTIQQPYSTHLRIRYGDYQTDTGWFRQFTVVARFACALRGCAHDSRAEPPVSPDRRWMTVTVRTVISPVIRSSVTVQLAISVTV